MRGKTYIGKLKRFIVWTAIVLAPMLVFIAVSNTASASVVDGWRNGIIAFLGTALGSDKVSAKTNPAGTVGKDSQKMELPSYANGYNPQPILVDSVLPVQTGGTLVADMDTDAAGTGSDKVNVSKSTYVVQADDTLSGISNIFDISVDTIKEANPDIFSKRKVIRPGDQLVILPIDGVLYTVVAGDSIQKVADKFKVEPGDIYAYNGLSTSSVLNRGQELIIPHGKPSTSAVQTYLAGQKNRVPSFEPLLDPVWNWSAFAPGFVCPVPGGRLTQGLHGHNAVDLAIGYGTPIRAAAAGTIIVSKANGLWNGGYGNFVMISHQGGVETLYAHMSKTAVAPGDTVSAGEVIGYIGMTGMTTGPHVHFEIRGAVNPFVDPSLCR